MNEITNGFIITGFRNPIGFSSIATHRASSRTTAGTKFGQNGITIFPVSKRQATQKLVFRVEISHLAQKARLPEERIQFK